jgi:hypothetical protein
VEVSMTDQNDGPDRPPLSDAAWDIRREGRQWNADEALSRFALTPEKFEMYQGKLFWSEADRVTLLALLLENVGADRAVRLGNPDVWRGAVQELG